MHLAIWLDSPSVLDVLVDDAGDAHGQERVVPAAHEHDGQTEHHAQQRQRPSSRSGKREKEETPSAF